jgi:hypothetical protein
VSTPKASAVLAGLKTCLITLLAVTACPSAPPAAALADQAGTPLVVAAIDDSQVVPLEGSVHPFAVPQNDAGPVPANLAMRRLEIVLRRSPAQEAQLEQLIVDQQDRGSPRYHHWLTPAEFGAEFGANPQDLELAVRWLEAHGFEIGSVPAGRGRVPFFGTAAQVEATFHTAIHFFNVAGERHLANVSRPQIPSAFAPLVAGIRGLNDFHPRPLLQHRATAPPRPNYVTGGNDLVGPADFATIYNLTPLYADQIFGSGVSIAIASQSDIDQTTPPAYWSAFGVTVAHAVSYLTPNGDPGINAAEDESDLDVETAGSLAPDAQIILVSSTDATTSAEYVIDQNLAAILSISYGNCEVQLGTAGNAATNSDFQQAVTQGITVIVSSGDQGSAACDDAAAAVDGLAVNGLASTPYDVAVGGTDFNPTLVAQGNYWSAANSPGTLETALSYIPEMVWNFSCTNPVYIAQFTPGDLNPIDFCNNASYSSYVTISAGSGGLSSASLPSGDTYTGYAQPAWQAGVVGIQAFGARALPDVSLQATIWAICTGASSSCNPASGDISVVGGTSAAAPAFAAIMALLDQTQISSGNPDGRQGLINPVLYQLAASEYGSTASPNNTNLTACNSSQGASVGASCVFYDITVGNNSVPCKVARYVGEPPGTHPTAVCATSTGDTYGVLELNSTLAYTSTAGFDLATGLGTLNAANFVNDAAGAPSGLTATLQSGTATLSWKANPSAPQGTTYNVYEGTAPGAEGAAPIQTGLTKASTTVSGLTTAGQAYYFRVAAVSGAQVSFKSNEAAVANAPAAATGITAVANGTGFTVSWNASFGASSYSIYFGTSPGAESATPDPSGITGTSQSFSSAGGTRFYLKVVAVNFGGSSPASAEASVTVAPAAPGGLYATPSTSAVTLNWLPSNGALSYSIYEGTSPGGESATAVQSGITATSATITGLSSGQNYFFTVKATSAGGTSSASGEAATQTAPAPPTPTSDSAFFGTVAADEGNLTPASPLSSTPQSPVPDGAAPSLELNRGAPLLKAAANAAPDPARSAASSSDTHNAAVPENGGGGALGVIELLGCGILIVVGIFREPRRIRYTTGTGINSAESQVSLQAAPCAKLRGFALI